MVYRFIFIVGCLFFISLFPTDNVGNGSFAYADTKKPTPYKIKSKAVKRKIVTLKKSVSSLKFRKKLKSRDRISGTNFELKHGQEITLRPNDLRSLPASRSSLIKVKKTESKKENARLNSIGYSSSPIKNRSKVLTIITTKPKQFVRVYTDGVTSKNGRWLMKAKDINNLTPAQIQYKYALPKKPTHFAPVVVPALTRLSISIVGRQNFSKHSAGGGIQYEYRSINHLKFGDGQPIRGIFRAQN